MDESKNLSKVYDPKQVEEKWYATWKNNKYFAATVKEGRPNFSIVMPPPNVTGKLHMGHAMDNTMQDILVRYKRLQGFNTLWVPGTDHAGIATQAKVEAQLQSEGTNRYEVGREEFLRRTWAWKEEYGNTITTQLRKLGSSCDWDRERFTYDEGLSGAVRDVFVTLYERGLMYKGKRLVNWCPRCGTALADDEVDHEDTQGAMYHLYYEYADGSGKIEVATTRPETFFGDTAVAVNPKDERYKAIVGKMLKLPLTGKEIPIIADEYVDMSFGTGAVKVTPAHDPNDYQIALRHNLEMPICMNEDGTMNELCGEFNGLDRFECREKLLEKFELTNLGELHTFKGKELEGITCVHPLYPDRESIIILGDHVTDEDGTGCVHTAPGHGAEDFFVGVKYNLPAFCPVDEKGNPIKVAADGSLILTDENILWL